MAVKPYAEVIVDVTARKLDRIFHYRVPQVLAGRLTVGMRVVVPFGRRTVEGYILGFCDAPEIPEKDIRDIIDIVEQDTLLNPDLLALALWMSERYMCPKIDAVHSVMPAGARTVARRYVVALAEPIPAGAESPGALNIPEKDIYSYIVKYGKTSYKELNSLFGTRKTGETLKKLAGLGLVEILGEMKAKVRPRIVQKLDTALAKEELNRLITSLEATAPKQAAVLKTVREKGALTLQELARQAGTTPATVRELVKKGYLAPKQTRIRRDPYAFRSFTATEPLNLTPKQSSCLREILLAIDQGRPDVFLLHGVTGSGKTEIYLQAIAHCLDQGRQAIVLVPEISLTPQMVERFKGRFGDLVAVLHSRLSAGERYDEWREVKTGRVKVVVGARSAVFAPFADPGLIIIDEEHETSYKQEDNPKYHARDVAIARARLTKSVVVLGSATPSLESYARGVAGKYRLLSLEDRVTGQPLPEVSVVDLREEMRSGHKSIFSRQLIAKIRNVLARGQQAILFLNRRGYSTFVVCRECGLVMKCPKCSITLTFHSGENMLRCHYCDFRRKSPDICPACGSGSIRHFGIGTQKVEEEVFRWFPGARVARMDMDTTSRKGSHEKILDDFREGKVDILVGTQMIAKGLDFPGVTLVGIITADTALNLPDFRAAERTFQLITQVAGRAGRGTAPGEVILQTYNPEHYSIVNARAHNYTAFYREEMKTREALGYPPYTSLVRIVVHGLEENSVIRGAELLAANLRQALSGYSLGVNQPLLGPAPAPVSKLRSRYRWQICVRGRPGALTRRIVGETVRKAESDSFFADLGISIDVDPVNLM